MTEYFDILLPGLAITAFVANAIHVMFFMDQSPGGPRKIVDDREGDVLKPQPPGSLIAIAASEALRLTAPAPGAHIPKDPVLRRHYLTHLCSQLNELYLRPSESVLRRHHGQLIASHLEECLFEQAAVEKLQAAYEILKKRDAEEVANPIGVGMAPFAAPDVEPEAVTEVSLSSGLKVQEAEPGFKLPPMGTHVPKDHVLRRHYLTHLLGMLQDLYPSPADSVLRRHHQQQFKNLFAVTLEHEAALEQLKLDWLAARKVLETGLNRLEPAKFQSVDKAEKKAALFEATVYSPVFGPHVPQDHVLRRHYLALLESRLNEMASCPTDSVLRRHHQQWMGAQLAQCIGDATSAAAFQSDYERWVRERGKTACKSNLLAEEGNSITLATKPLTREPLSARKAFKLPEDSVLKRHCMQYLTAEIEKFMPRPRDSVLSRHYDQWLASEIEVLL
jgi:hypothetical protein